MTELAYQSPTATLRRSWITTLLLLAAACPFLVLSVAIIVLAISAIVDGPSSPPTAADILVGIFLWCCCTILSVLLLKRADPYRTLPAPAPGEQRPSFTRLSILALACSLFALLLAISAGTIHGILLRYTFFHPALSFTAAIRSFGVLLLLLAVAAATCALLDIISATVSPVPRRGYALACLALALVCSLIFIVGASTQDADRFSSIALSARYREFVAIADAATSLRSNRNPPSDPRYIFPLTPAELDALPSRGPLPTFNLILAIRRAPLPAVPALWTHSGPLQYAHEGILVCFASGNVRVILPGDWPKTWASHNTARAKLSLPPQPDPPGAVNPATLRRAAPYRAHPLWCFSVCRKTLTGVPTLNTTQFR